jgi:hypothetical protein
MLIVLVILMPGGYGVATGGPLAWGLCYNHEMSPAQTYCDDYYKVDYPCTPGAEYYGRGAIPIYWYAYSLLIIEVLFSSFFWPKGSLVLQVSFLLLNL